MARGKQTLTQRIALDGGKEIQEELKKLGSVGEIMFNRLAAAADRNAVATTGFNGKLNDLRKGIDNVQGAVGRLTSRFGGLASQIATVGGAIAGAFSVRALVDITSKWTDLNSQVRLAIDSNQSVDEVMGRLTETANRTYSSLQLTVEGFARNAAVLGELGLSTQQQLAYQESLNNALVVSNARGQRAQQVQDALSKAMALGVLRGENLNSVMSAGGRVTQLLAKELGTTTGGLRKLGEQGQITSAVIAKALIGNLAQLREEAESMPATIVDGFLRIENALLSYIGNADQATGVSRAIADALIFISENIDIAVIGLSSLVGAMLLVKAVGLATDLIAIGRAIFGLVPPLLAVAAAILANPLILIPTVIAGVIVAVLALTGTLDDFVGFIFNAFGYAVKLVADFIGFIGGAIKAVAEFFGFLGDDDKKAEGLKKANDVLGDTSDLLKGVNLKTLDVNSGLEDTKKKLTDASSGFGKLGQDATSAFDQIGSGIKRVVTDFDTMLGRLQHNTQQATALYNALASVGGDSGSFHALRSNGEGDSFAHLATGGPVNGPGTGTSDSILSWLSNGEYVVKAKAVRKYGLGLLSAINNMRFNPGAFSSGGLARALGAGFPSMRGGLPAFAGGGPVGPTGRPLTLNIAGDVFEGLIAPDTVAERLVTYAHGRQIRQMGKKPSWLGGGS